ncbi:L-serine dehydratase 1 [Serratia fonticola]|uniref:L-serine ammonia-lyase n=1 Tax=Serratia fonticola TaxID=47917 RepID=A0A4U9W355_SERFO|nr:L-serine dehydratase 1 [Serratia fonticola]
MPDTVDIDGIPGFIRDVEQRQRLMLASGLHEVDFPRDGGMVFRSDNMPLHENAMQIHAFAGDKQIYSKTYYSIGGGFIVDEEHFGKAESNEISVPYPFHSASEMLAHCHATGLSLSGMVMQNELALHSKQEIEAYFGNVWQTMRACIDRGLNTEGVLPGPLRVPRRASALRRLLVSSDKLSSDPMKRDRLGQHVLRWR